MCLITDWSKVGVGFVLWQKRCGCKTIHPSCCKGGWAVVCVGSRYCTGAESRYAPIEGELMGVVWALHRTSHYTLGCEKLLVLVDHKPLLGLLEKRELGEIENPRLGSLAEKTMRWTFKIEHVAGAENFGPDALSRFPAPGRVVGSVKSLSLTDHAWSDEVEAGVVALASSRGVNVVSWDAVKKEGIQDPMTASLLHHLQLPVEGWPEELQTFRRFAPDLSNVDGVVMYRGRTYVPFVLRCDVLQSLHQAHQGTTGMMLRAG